MVLLYSPLEGSAPFWKVATNFGALFFWLGKMGRTIHLHLCHSFYSFILEAHVLGTIARPDLLQVLTRITR